MNTLKLSSNRPEELIPNLSPLELGKAQNPKFTPICWCPIYAIQIKPHPQH